MTPRDVNLINILLMGLAAAIAWERPVELFFFSYGVLGPLHYLTQISWLEKRDWFSSSRRDWIVPAAAAAGLTVLYVLADTKTYTAQFMPALFGEGARRATWGDLLLWIAIATTVAGAFFRRAAVKVLVAAAVLVLGLWVLGDASGRRLTSVFLPTLIHVFLFTSSFILFGALKGRSPSGYASFAVHLGLGALLLWAPASWGLLTVTPENQKKLGGFLTVVHETAVLIGVTEPPLEARRFAVNALRFMAYAYTYHYLNWFSKTGVIRWHEVSRKRLWTICVVWIVSVAWYAVDWKSAFTALLALSLAHVLLEFPLNWRTFVGIGGELRARVVRPSRGRTDRTDQSPAAAR